MGIGIVIRCIGITFLVMSCLVNGTKCEKGFRIHLIAENDVTSNKLIENKEI